MKHVITAGEPGTSVTNAAPRSWTSRGHEMDQSTAWIVSIPSCPTVHRNSTGKTLTCVRHVTQFSSSIGRCMDSCLAKRAWKWGTGVIFVRSQEIRKLVRIVLCFPSTQKFCSIRPSSNVALFSVVCRTTVDSNVELNLVVPDSTDSNVESG